MFEITTVLRAPPEAVWARASSVEGIRDELRPLADMTFPASIEALNEATVPLGERLCRSWILLFGVLPVEYDDVTLVELEPGRRFLERSQMLTLREWRHERIVEPHPDGSTMTDRLSWDARLPLPDALVRSIVATLFRHRHRRLAAYWGVTRAGRTTR